MARLIFRTLSIFNIKVIVLVLFCITVALAGCLDGQEEVIKPEPGKKLSCRQASEYIGVKASDFPVIQFSIVRMVQEGRPTTMDFVKNRTTIVYNEAGYIINARCG